MAAIGKKFGQLKQWTGEKMGSSQRTELSSEFKQLEQDTATRIEFAEKLHCSLDVYLNSVSKPKDIDHIKGKKSGCEGIAIAMLSYAQHVPQSHFTRALVTIGDGHDKVAVQQAQFASNGRETILYGFQRTLAEMKEYEAARAKMEKRRLDLDAKLNRLTKVKKEKPELEEETRIAQNKYEDSLRDISSRMIDLANREQEQLESMLTFVDEEAEYYQRCADILSAAKAKLADIPRQPHFNNPANRGIRAASASPQRVAEPVTASFGTSAPSATLFVPDQGSNIAGSRSVSRSESNVSNASFKSADPNVGRRVKCLFDFVPENEGEMAIQKGDIITVTCQISEGWWEGDNQTTRQHGMFPSNYCEPIQESAAPSPPTRAPGVPASATSSASASASMPTSRSPSFNYLAGNAPGAGLSASMQSVRSSNGNLAPPGMTGSGSTDFQSRSRGSSVASSTGRSRSQSPVPPSPASKRNTSPRNSSPIPPAPRSREPSEIGSRASLASATTNPFTQPNIAVNAGPCGQCGCEEYAPHAFKKDQCNNCYHQH